MSTRTKILSVISLILFILGAVTCYAWIWTSDQHWGQTVGLIAVLLFCAGFGAAMSNIADE